MPCYIVTFHAKTAANPSVTSGSGIRENVDNLLDSLLHYVRNFQDVTGRRSCLLTTAKM
jgi:hypothetical protein